MSDSTGNFFILDIFCGGSVRFMLGGENGKLKYGPPDGHSPVCESLLPKEKLKIEQCFNLGNMPKGQICGLPEELDHRVFVPRPVDTSHVSVQSVLNFKFFDFFMILIRNQASSIV